MNFKEKLEIYDLLLENYSIGTRIHLANIGNWLTSHNLTPQHFGYEKILTLIQDCPEIITLSSEIPREGVPPVYYVTLLPRPSHEENFHTPESLNESEPGFQLPSEMNESTIFFPPSNQKRVNHSLIGEDVIFRAEQWALVKQSYSEAVEKNDFSYDAEHDAYSFCLQQKGIDDGTIRISLHRTERSGAPWYVNFVYIFPGIKPSDALCSFAYLGKISDFLQDLAEHAQNEPWDFPGSGNERNILKQYINYTFYRLQQEDKICIDPNGEFAAFNTGLQSPGGEDLLAYFICNEGNGNSPWRFECFCSTDSSTAAERACYKKILNEFSEPELPVYFTNITDLLFDTRCTVRISYDHILSDNVDRLPLDLLKRECYGHSYAWSLIEKIETSNSRNERSSFFYQLGKYITETPDLFTGLKDRLNGAKERAIRKIQRNYKLAVPCFFPTRNTMSMMLPLSFTATGSPSVVLVCERTPRGEYFGQTILTMDMAYIDARLLCRPASDWLNVHLIEVQDMDSWEQ